MKLKRCLYCHAEDSIESNGSITVNEYSDEVSVEEFLQRVISIAEEKDETDVTIRFISHYDEFLGRNVVKGCLVKTCSSSEEWVISK